MKKQALVNIKFVHNGTAYLAKVYLHKKTAIVLPDTTVLVTNPIVLKSGSRRSPKDQKHVRQIFNQNGELMPLTVLHKSNDGKNKNPFKVYPFEVFAELDPSKQ